MMDLLVFDLPQSGEQGFAWSDGVFLKAIHEANWVLLDELNHRGTVYIPELPKEYECKDTFRVFAAQKPVNEGGGKRHYLLHF